MYFLPYNKNLVLVGLSDGTLSLFDGIKYYDFKINDDGYLRENILSEGISLGDTAYAFSTLDGGAVVIEKASRKVLFTINNQTNLPDDEVFAIGSDNSGGLWLSHQFGLTRADLNLPVENYSIFPGLKGNLSSALRFDNELYVATSEGVFYLTESRDYSEYEVLVKNETAPQSVEVAPSAVTQEQKGERKNIFSRIFGKKNVQPASIPAPDAETKQVPQYTRKKVSRLKSINYLFTQVSGLNEKCRQIVSTPAGLLAATNKGFYFIKDHKAVLIESNRYINNISWTPYEGKYYVAANDGYFAVIYQGGKWVTVVPDPGFNDAVYSIIQENARILWLGCDNLAYRVEITDGDHAGKYSSYRLGKDFPERYSPTMGNDTIFLFTETEVHYYNSISDKFETYNPVVNESEANGASIFPLSNIPLMRLNDKWVSLKPDPEINSMELSLLNLFDFVASVNVEDESLWIIDGNNKLFGMDRSRSLMINPPVNVLFKNISNDRGISFSLESVVFERGDNIINFDIIAPSFLKQNVIQYQYYIDKIMPDWSVWSSRTHYEKAINKPGDYILQVRAKDLWGNVSERRALKFRIKAPFIKTPFFYLMSGIILLTLVVLVVRFREKQLQVKNRLLEEKVRERTAEIEAQKQEITSSIEYAKRIQDAMLPVEENFRKYFSDYFILFKPRDIVSGDFFWIGEDEKALFFTVGDCTGHGVPGAFMSTMGISTLNEIIANNRNLQANKVLNTLRLKIMNALHQTGKEGEAADGMDIAFCILYKERNILQYSGAYNPLLIFQGGELKEYKADRMPIGIHYGKEMPFTNYVINVTSGDTVYIFTDGFNDQFGGPEGSKFKKSNLKKLLSEIYYRPMIEQRNILEAEFARWKGNNPQVDDITIIGLRI
jgi:serine phosphatase RsbU (regulator of sigma subunit)